MSLSKKNLLVLIVCVGAAALLLGLMPIDSSATQPENVRPAGQAGYWDLIFNDEFDGQTLDINKWATCYWWDQQGCSNEGNNELQWYSPQNISTANGSLHLTARKETVKASNGKTYAYTSGMVTTGRMVDNILESARFPFLYGYVEARVKIPAGKGLWPAIWMLPSDQVSKPEIDVMEMLGDNMKSVFMNFHYLGADGTPNRSSGEWQSSEDLSAGWHTFAVDWQPDAIVWYVDGVERRRFDDKPHIPNKPMYLLINLAVGGEWAGNPDANTPFPSDFEVDYVRIWKKTGNITMLASADAYVDADTPTANFGRDRTLVVDGSPDRIIYMKFDLPTLTGKKITSAILRVRTTGESTSGSENSQGVYQVSDAWDEYTITYNNRPPINSYIIGLIDKTEQNITYDIPLSVDEVQKMGGKTLSLAVVATGFDGLYIYSREFRPFYPQLILSTTDSSQATTTPVAR